MRAEVICGECWIEFGGIDCRCADADRSGQDSVLDPVEVPGAEGRGAESEGQGIALNRACECAGCCFGSVESQGGQIEQKSEAV